MKSHTPAPRSRSFEIKEDCTLMPFLLQAMQDQSRNSVKSLLAHKLVQVNNRLTTQFDTPLKPGDTVTVGMNKSAAPFHHSMLNIVYEDNDLIVVEKASGLLSMGTERDKTKTAYHILNDYVKSKNPRNHVLILHRLDKETSGIMMFAKNLKTQEILQKNWNEMILERKYVAILEGCPQEERGQVKSYITENKAFVVHSARDEKLAITNYTVQKPNRQYSLVELNLETGRKNQIRVHMQELGNPVAGDKKYGATKDPIRRLALHAFKLHFTHPITGKEMKFETPIPSKFTSLFKQPKK
ncbi:MULTISPECIES: RluA family pseudouridine synthase [Butyricimonas]|uniref:RluA family pseudouridine synthase n=1 Tax=Butyricimonas TaxID=574697 RepID=UPI0007FB4B58|nr:MULTISPECIES: RluA family pseudouridine synthase [Butyricimonas]